MLPLNDAKAKLAETNTARTSRYLRRANLKEKMEEKAPKGPQDLKDSKKPETSGIPMDPKIAKEKTNSEYGIKRRLSLIHI